MGKIIIEIDPKVVAYHHKTWERIGFPSSIRYSIGSRSEGIHDIDQLRNIFNKTLKELEANLSTYHTSRLSTQTTIKEKEK